MPTIEQVMKCYRVIAQVERMKTGRPGVNTVLNVLRGTMSVCSAAGIPVDSQVDAMTRQRIDTALASFMGRGLTRLSAWTYVSQMRGLFAKWCTPYYRDAGWTLPPLDLPSFRAMPPRYVRPSAELLARVKAWYSRQTDEHWFAATMMLEFAMRNGDVLRLKDENFVTRSPECIKPDGDSSVCGNAAKHYLSYTPHKTALSSGRRVCWPIHDDIWARFDDYGGLSGLDVTEETFTEINRELRILGFHGTKAAYELRKICIDHVYQRFGAEMAVSISGDDIKTITRYYADPAQPNIGAMRIIDLL